MFQPFPRFGSADAVLRRHLGGVLSRWLQALGRPAVFAHRGASRMAPENSLAALRLAAEAGADGVEFDVQRCASGELVVFHDRSLARCTGRVGAVDELPLSELRSLALDRVDRSIGGRSPGERIPLLDEWLAAAPPGLFLNLEVKSTSLADAELGAACARALAAHDMLQRSLLSSFNPLALARAALAAPRVARGALFEAGPDWRAYAAAGLAAWPAAVHPQASLVTEARVRLWHGLGLRVAAWTVDAPEEMQRCLDAGVDVLITNAPEVARRLVERYRS